MVIDPCHYFSLSPSFRSWHDSLGIQNSVICFNDLYPGIGAQKPQALWLTLCKGKGWCSCFIRNGNKGC